MAGLVEVAKIKQQNEMLRNRMRMAPSLIESQALPITSTYRPDLQGMSAESGTYNASEFGSRWDMRDGAKGLGWLGPIKHPEGGVATEVSIDAPDAYGELRGQPAIVPTLTRDELNHILTAKGKWDINDPVVRSIYRKSDEHAALRRALRLSPFVD